MSLKPSWAVAAWTAVALAAICGPAVAQKAAPKRVAASYSRIERSLAGIRIGTKATTLLRSYPNPVVQMGAGGGASTDAFGGAVGGGEFGGGGLASPFPTAGPSGMPMPGGPPSGSPFPGGPGMALPPVGAGGPFPGAPGADFGSSGTGTDTGTVGPSVTYYYKNFRKRTNLDVLVQIDEDGRVIQVIATSPKPVPGVTTARGLGFGATYAQVVAKYGWPESQTSSGGFLQMNYQETAHVAFQLLGVGDEVQRVRRIVVAEVE